MGWYRRTPLVVRALRYDGTAASRDALRDAFGSEVRVEYACGLEALPTGRLVAYTPCGEQHAEVGDWLVGGIGREIAVVTDALFRQSYVPEDARAIEEWKQV